MWTISQREHSAATSSFITAIPASFPFRHAFYCFYMFIDVHRKLQSTTIGTLYVFVDIQIDVPHLVATIKLNFPDTQARFALSLVWTILFDLLI